jgi:hypothetical protein
MIEAMKQALEALEKNYKLINGEGTRFGLEGAMDGYYSGCFDVDGTNKETENAIASLRQAIAELESQEPVAWMFQHDETGRMNYVSNDGIHNPTVFLEMNPRYALVCPLYTHPPQRTWVGLTDEEIKKTAKKHRWHESNVAPHLMPIFRSLEAKLKELNS